MALLVLQTYIHERKKRVQSDDTFWGYARLGIFWTGARTQQRSSRLTPGHFLQYSFDHFGPVRDQNLHFLKKLLQFPGRGSQHSEPHDLISRRQGTSRDLSSRNSSSSFLGAVPSPDAFIHWWRVRHINHESQSVKGRTHYSLVG